MKNLLESFAVFLVVALSLLIVFLIVQYNMIEEEAVEEIVLMQPETKESKKAKTASYLDSLEGYGGDVDVKVDATKEKLVNVVAVKSEVNEDELDSAVEDKAKSSYMENLVSYEAETEKEEREDSVKKAMEDVKPKVKAASHGHGAPAKEAVEPEKLPEDEIEDEIGMAIDAALEDL